MQSTRTILSALTLAATVAASVAGAAPATADSRPAPYPPGAAPGFSPVFTPQSCDPPPPPPPPMASAAAVGGAVATGGADPLTAPAPTASRPPVRCGFVSVPLDHRDTARGTIQLAVAVFPALEPAATPVDPLLMLGGGPGEQMVTPLVAFRDVPGTNLDRLRRTHDLIIMDQRGVGASRPALECPEIEAASRSLPPDASEDQQREAAGTAVRSCHDRLTGAGIDLSAFNTANNVRDLDLVRAALGYQKLHVFGTSYGARLAWQAVRAFPEHLASVVLSSAIPAEEDFIADLPASYGRDLGAIVDTCARDAACAASYPNLRADLGAALRQLHDDPLRVAVPDRATGTTVERPVDDHSFASILFSSLYFPAGISVAPYLIGRVAARDTTTLSSLMGSSSDGGISRGMYFSFVCAEEIPHTDQRELARNLWVGGPYGRALWPGQALLPEVICPAWNVPTGDPQVFEPIRTDVPTLVVAGQLDPVTPPAYGRRIHRQAAGSQYVEVPGMGHSPLLFAGACGLGLLDSFVADPRRPVDTSCLSTASPFLPPDQAAARLRPPAT